MHQLFDEIELAVTAFTDDLWQREGEEDLLRVPAFLAHHTVWCICLGHLLNIPHDRMPSNPTFPPYRRENMPTREQLVALLNDIRAYTDEVYGQMPNEAYLAKGENGMEPLGMVMYTIAHTRHHLGQLSQLLKENGLGPPKWYPR
jgi:hypothetical protein